MQRPSLSPWERLYRSRDLFYDHVPSNRYTAYTLHNSCGAAPHKSTAGLVAQRFTRLRLGFPLD